MATHQSAATPIPASPSPTTRPVQPIDAETRQLAAMAYGEASAKNDANEIWALASVLKRQRDARGYSTIKDFASSERSFSYVTSDSNQRYTKMMAANEAAIANDPTMGVAIDAAKNALANGPDKSNGAWFWDGADIKSNYTAHPKVRLGIKFTSPKHNIYNVKESTKLVIKYKYAKKREKNKVTVEKTEVYRYDHVYESTEAHGGTIFWKFGADYLTHTHAKEYR